MSCECHVGLLRHRCVFKVCFLFVCVFVVSFFTGQFPQKGRHGCLHSGEGDRGHTFHDEDFHLSPPLPSTGESVHLFPAKTQPDILLAVP